MRSLTVERNLLDHGFRLFRDNEEIRLGDSNDIQLRWDGTDLDLLAAADDTVFKIGNGTNSFDIWIYGNAATEYILWDASANDLVFQDNVSLMLGTGNDVEIRWDATDLDILAAANNSVIKFGNGTNSFDIWVYGSAATNYLEWDASANKLNFTGLVRAVWSSTYNAAGSYQNIESDMTLGVNAGTSAAGDSDFLAPIMGNVLGTNLTKTKNYIAGGIFHYTVDGTNASTYPVGAVLAGIGDNTTTADGAVVAYIDGDSATTTAGAAFKVMHNSSIAASKFTYGVDLYDAAHDGYNAVDYATADIRLHNQMVIHNDEADRTMIGARIGICDDASPASNAPANGCIFFFDGTDLKAKNASGQTATLNNAAFA